MTPILLVAVLAAPNRVSPVATLQLRPWLDAKHVAVGTGDLSRKPVVYAPP